MTRCDMHDAGTEDAAAARLELKFPAWLVWVSETGAWWASRREQLTAADLAAGCAQYVRADGPAGLAELLAGQESLGAESE